MLTYNTFFDNKLINIKYLKKKHQTVKNMFDVSKNFINKNANLCIKPKLEKVP